MSGAILSRDPGRGAASGALGALVAETVVDLLPQTVLRDLHRLYEQDKARGNLRSFEGFKRLTQDERYMRSRIGEMAAILTVGLARQDVTIAQKTASTALEHNFIMGALAARYLVYTAYDNVDTYQTEMVLSSMLRPF